MVPYNAHFSDFYFPSQTPVASQNKISKTEKIEYLSLSLQPPTKNVQLELPAKQLLTQQREIYIIRENN